MCVMYKIYKMHLVTFYNILNKYERYNCKKLFIIILSQSYNAAVFYFDNISFSRACIKLIISPKRKFNQSSILPTMVSTICSNCSRNKPFCGGRVVEKNELNSHVPVSDMRHAFRAAEKMC